MVAFIRVVFPLLHKFLYMQEEWHRNNFSGASRGFIGCRLGYPPCRIFSISPQKSLEDFGVCLSFAREILASFKYNVMMGELTLLQTSYQICGGLHFEVVLQSGLSYTLNTKAHPHTCADVIFRSRLSKIFA